MEMTLEQKIEAILFFRSDPVPVDLLSKILKASKEETAEALTHLEEHLRGRGIRLMRMGDDVMLGTAPEISSLIEGLIREELDRDLGKAGLETLTIVLYRGPISRSEIDYIRGVNSRYILRHLEVRGLIEKEEKKDDKRVFLYKATFDLLRYLGIGSVEELPEYSRVKSEMAEPISNDPHE